MIFVKRHQSKCTLKFHKTRLAWGLKESNFVLALGTSASAVKRRFPGNSAIRFMEKKKHQQNPTTCLHKGRCSCFLLFSTVIEVITSREQKTHLFTSALMMSWFFYIYINYIRPNLFVLYSYNFINIIFFELPTRTTEIPLND